eukprot:GHVU01060468.1.p1 GENE.GHVU01060468.1~~GHVU01060468.1.p1  ORF type:complete len:112 (+),score=11.83 GHVU01060468.1:222-557(+)
MRRIIYPEVPPVAYFKSTESYLPIEKWARDDAIALQMRFRRIAYLRRKYCTIVREYIVKSKERLALTSETTGKRKRSEAITWQPACWLFFIQELELDEDVLDAAQEKAGEY